MIFKRVKYQLHLKADKELWYTTTKDGHVSYHLFRLGFDKVNVADATYKCVTLVLPFILFRLVKRCPADGETRDVV